MEKPSILVVDDSPMTQKTLSEFFSGLGCRVYKVQSAEEALDLLEKQALPNVIILDFKLPGMSGPEFYNRVVKNPVWWEKLTVIPFTSQDLSNGNRWTGTVSKKDANEHTGTVPASLIYAVGIAAVGIAIQKKGFSLSEEFEGLIDSSKPDDVIFIKKWNDLK